MSRIVQLALVSADIVADFCRLPAASPASDLLIYQDQNSERGTYRTCTPRSSTASALSCATSQAALPMKRYEPRDERHPTTIAGPHRRLVVAAAMRLPTAYAALNE